MPRPKRPGAPEPKRRSRNGCWPCKAKKVKCGEEKPRCLNCERQKEECDYSIRLNWDGRTKKKVQDEPQESPGKESGIKAEVLPLNMIMEMSPKGSASTREGSGGLAPIGQDSDFQQLHHNRLQWNYLHGKANIRQSEEYGSSGSGTHSSSYKPVGKTATPPSAAPMLDESSDYTISKSPEPQRSTKYQFCADQASRLQGERTYLSPSSSDINHPRGQSTRSLGSVGSGHDAKGFQTLPPLQSTSYMHASTSYPDGSPAARAMSLEHRNKRMRLTSGSGQRSIHYRGDYNFQALHNDRVSPGLTGLRPMSLSLQSSQASFFAMRSPTMTVGTPPTPSASSLASDDNRYRYSTKPSPASIHTSTDIRRLSVNSLLSSPIKADSKLQDVQTESYDENEDADSPTTLYGIDRGLPDLDMPKNDDLNALSVGSPVLTAGTPYLTVDHSNIDLPTEFGFGLNGLHTAGSIGGYYAKPVPVTIPPSLEPLPLMLMENPMNLLYFHHFLNHTARILVPHDCSENPFRNILPQMAVRDPNLMHLLLAYSASHRARLLNQPEPANRIAIWVRDVFPTFAQGLTNTSGQISNSSLATAIMLASLQIISPNTFEVPVPWQNHLKTARGLIIARGGPQAIHRKDKVSYFLSRWFAYLDVLGSLSGGNNDQPLFGGDYLSQADNANEENHFEIDCLLGFTSRCVSILAKIAELARQCDNERIDSYANIRAEWKPSPLTVSAAEKLRCDLLAAGTQGHKGCPHRQGSTEYEDEWESREMVATNEAFHWAGLLHLDRRVLGKQSDDAEVQEAVQKILDALENVREGGTAEACLLFPMFTAGCDAKIKSQQLRIMARITSVEASGMTQVHKARRLMEKVWETGRPWETLVQAKIHHCWDMHLIELRNQPYSHKQDELLKMVENHLLEGEDQPREVDVGAEALVDLVNCLGNLLATLEAHPLMDRITPMSSPRPLFWTWHFVRRTFYTVMHVSEEINRVANSNIAPSTEQEKKLKADYQAGLKLCRDSSMLVSDNTGRNLASVMGVASAQAFDFGRDAKGRAEAIALFLIYIDEMQ